MYKPQLQKLKISFFIYVIFSSQALKASPLCTQIVASGNPEYPPYLWRDPHDDTRLIGANADLMNLIAQEIGIKIVVKHLGDWGRVQEETKQGKIDLIAGAFFNLRRLEYMDYIHPPVRETKTVIWTQKEARFSYQKWSDLKGLQGVTVINNSFGEEFDRYAKESLKILTVPSLEQALKMVQSGRMNYLIYELDPGLAYAARLNIKNLKTMSPPIGHEDLYVTLSYKSPCNTPEIRGLLAKALYKLIRQKSVMKKLIRNNIQLWENQQILAHNGRN